MFVTQQTARHIRTHQTRINQSHQNVFFSSCRLSSIPINVADWKITVFHWNGKMRCHSHSHFSDAGWSISIMLWHDFFLNYYSIDIFFCFISPNYFENILCATFSIFGSISKRIYIGNEVSLQPLIIVINAQKKAKQDNTQQNAKDNNKKWQ